MILRDREEYNRTARKCAMGLEYNGIKYDNILIIKNKPNQWFFSIWIIVFTGGLLIEIIL